MSILQEIRIQNNLQRIQLEESLTQTKFSSKQLTLYQNEYDYRQNQSNLQVTSDLNKFRLALFTISELGNTIDNYNSEKNEFFRKLKDVIESQLSNSYLLKHKNLETEWANMHGLIVDCMSVINETRPSSILIPNLTPSKVKADSTFINQFALTWFETFYNKLLNFYNLSLKQYIRDY